MNGRTLLIPFKKEKPFMSKDLSRRVSPTRLECDNYHYRYLYYVFIFLWLF